MKIRMQPTILLLSISLIISTLAACVSINKTKQNMAVYDFGLSIPNESDQQIISKIFLDEPVAVESLKHNKVRYRLNYQNPLRVFYYAESRWAATPSELLPIKQSSMGYLTNAPMNFRVNRKIEAFDHVFQTAATSSGIVQLSALVIEKKIKKTI